MATHNPNQPTQGQSYNGNDNQFQQGAFSPKNKEDKNIENPDREALDDENPGDAYTARLTEDGLYHDDDGTDD